MIRRAARTDANHSEIKSALERIGCYVVDCAHVGQGFPDLVIAWRGRFAFLEIKDGAKSKSRRQLTAAQSIFHAAVEAKNCKVHVVTSVDEAIAAVQSETLGRTQ